MKFIPSILLAACLATGPAFAAETPVAMETEVQKLSYAMGLDLGAYFKNLEEEFDLKLLQHGIEDAYNGRESKLTEEEAVALQQAFSQRQKQKQVQKSVEMVAKNRKAAEEFLKENKTKEGVVETASGLQYKVIKKGEGAKPVATDTVKVHYKGTLLDGTEFDSSYKRNEPAVFPVNQVIAGWGEALPLMEVGSNYELYIPTDLAYGDRGAPPVIEPGSMLVFNVELLEIVKNETAEEGTKEKEVEPEDKQ